MTSTTKRQVVESPVSQGDDEIINYVLDTTPWGGSPSNVTVIVYDVTDAANTDDWEDVTNTVMPVNNPSVVGDDITFSPLKFLTDGHVYRMNMRFTTPVFLAAEAYCFVIGGE